MIRCSLETAAQWAGGRVCGLGSTVITGVCTDSCKAAPGTLFVPLDGAHADGHAFARDALLRGAGASLWREGMPDPPQAPLILVEDTLLALQGLARSYRNQLNATVIGITGSNGKTSTKDILAGILSAVGSTQKTPGNLNNHVGVPLTLLGLDEGAQYAVVEMGMSAPGEIARLAGIARPGIGIITGLGRAHLAQLGSPEAIADAKWELACGMEAGGALVYNGDSALLRARVVDYPLTLVTFGQSEGCDLRLRSYMQCPDGIRFTTSEEGCPTLFLPMQGRHQAMNALAAIGAARLLGLTYAEIRAGLALVEGTGCRCERVQVGDCTLLDDTYKSNPESVLAALDTLWQVDCRRRLFVMGDMADLGPRSAALHREIGRALDPERLDAVFACGEAVRETVHEASLRFPAGKAVHFDRAEDMRQALQDYVSDPSAVLIKASRVMQFEQFARWLREYKEAGHAQ